jgi:hypothetical protein
VHEFAHDNVFDALGLGPTEWATGREGNRSLLLGRSQVRARPGARGRNDAAWRRKQCGRAAARKQTEGLMRYRAEQRDCNQS